VTNQPQIVNSRPIERTQKATLSTHYPPPKFRRSFIIAIGEVL
jgi:hypothetical protein